jgi:hypothetical protein
MLLEQRSVIFGWLASLYFGASMLTARGGNGIYKVVKNVDYTSLLNINWQLQTDQVTKQKFPLIMKFTAFIPFLVAPTLATPFASPQDGQEVQNNGRNIGDDLLNACIESQIQLHQFQPGEDIPTVQDLRGIFVAGGLLVFGGELSDFARRITWMTLAISVMLACDKYAPPQSE